MAPPVSESTRGIIDPVRARTRFDHRRHDPSPRVARFVAWYAALSWDLGDDTHDQEILSHPVVNLVFGPDVVNVTGPCHTKVTRRLEGRRWALGVMFRPAGFRPLLDGPLTALTDRTQPAGDVLGGPVDAVQRRVAATDDWDERLALVDAFLADRLPEEPQPSEATTVIAERIATDRSLLRVDKLAVECGTSMRQLQRRFADQVGVSPKWVIQRYRLHEAAETAAAGGDVDWARLAVDLGYSDQAHLVRSFTRAIGVPPDRYARENSAPKD